ncbi:hypothetical protein LCGC14_2209800, partial [marine sediment metagenome]
ANHTSSFDLQIDQLRVDYSNKFDWYSVNAEIMWDLTDVIQTIEFLSYSHKTTEAANTILEVWDFTDTEWDLVNSSTNTNGFYDTQFDLSDSRYRDGSDNVKVRYRTAELMETPFNLLIDRLKVDYTTVRDVHKIDFEVIWDITDVTFNLMEFIKYSHKTNVSIDIDVDIYNFSSQTWFEIESEINSQTFDDDSFALSTDFYNGSNHVRLRFQSDTWETFNEKGFKLLLDRLIIDYEYYNAVYGYLGDSQYFSFIADNEVWNVSMYYLDGQNKIFIAYMEPDPSNPNRFEYNWDSIQSASGALTNDSIDIIFHLKDIFNSTNDIRYRFIADFDLPISQFTVGNGIESFEYTPANPLTPVSFTHKETAYYREFYRIIDNTMGIVHGWAQFNSSEVSILEDLSSTLPMNFTIEYRVIDYAGNEGTNTTYNSNYQSIIFSREKAIILSSDTIDLNLGGNRMISFANTGQFNNIQFLDAYINGFNYGTAYLDIDDYYKLSFGTSNSIDTLLGYSGSLISSNIYSNTDPLDHVSWEVREDDIFAAVKHVLVEDDIIINNPIAHTTFSALNIENLYNRGFGLEDFVYIKQVYYYNTSRTEDVQQVLSEDDYNIDEEGIVTFPETSIV